MNEKKNSKLVLAVIQGDDYYDVISELNKNGIFVTVLNSSGGFLKKRSVTVMIGIEEEKLDLALSILKTKAGRRTETFFQTFSTMQDGCFDSTPSIPIEGTFGGTTVFIMDLDKIEKF